MMPYLDSYDKATHDIGLRHVEWYEAVEVADFAEEVAAPPALRHDPIRSLAAWLTALVHSAPVRQVRRHA